MGFRPEEMTFVRHAMMCSTAAIRDTNESLPYPLAGLCLSIEYVNAYVSHDVAITEICVQVAGRRQQVVSRTVESMSGYFFTATSLP